MKYFRCNKDEVHAILVDRFLPGVQSVRVAEFGRMRSTDEGNRLGDGWSTKRFAEHPRVSEVWSVDNSIDTIKSCLSSMGYDALLKIRFLPKLEDFVSVPGPIHIAYLDGPDDAEVNLCALDLIKYRLCLTGCVVAVDDFSQRVKCASIGDQFGPEYMRCVIGDSIVFWGEWMSIGTSWMEEEIG